MTSSKRKLWPFCQPILLELSVFPIETQRKKKLLYFLNPLINYLKIWPEYIIWYTLLLQITKISNFSIPIVSIVFYCSSITRDLVIVMVVACEASESLKVSSLNFFYFIACEDLARLAI